MRPAQVKYYTKMRDYTDVHVTGGGLAYPAASRHAAGCPAAASHTPAAGCGCCPTSSSSCEEALVTVRFMGFHRVWQGSGRVFDSVELFLPDHQYETQVGLGAAIVQIPALCTCCAVTCCCMWLDQ